MAAGFNPAAFWDETPRSFVTIMEGAALAAERKHERELLVAHHGAAWAGAASVGKLREFSSYRKSTQEQQQSPKQMLGALRALQAMGAPMTIRQVN